MNIKQTIRRTAITGLAALTLAGCGKPAKPYSGISGSICAVPTINAENANAIGLILEDTTQFLTGKPGAVLRISDVGLATRSPVTETIHAYLRWEGSNDQQYTHSMISVVAPQGHAFYSMTASRLREMYMDLTKWQSRGMMSADCWHE